MRLTIRASELDHIGDIQQASSVKNNGVPKDTYSNLYTNVRSKKLNPLRRGEEVESFQEVAVERNSWLIRAEDRTITPKKSTYIVDGKTHHITGVREYMGGRLYLVLDTEFRDNQ